MSNIRANEIRSARAEYKRNFRTLSKAEQRTQLVGLIADPPDYMASQEIGKALTWYRGRGRERMLKILRRAGWIHEHETLSSMTPDQRDVLISILEK